MATLKKVEINMSPDGWHFKGECDDYEADAIVATLTEAHKQVSGVSKRKRAIARANDFATRYEALIFPVAIALFIVGVLTINLWSKPNADNHVPAQTSGLIPNGGGRSPNL